MSESVKEGKVSKLYKDLIRMSKEAIDDIQAPFKVRKEKKSLETKIIDVEQEIANKELLIQQEMSKSPVNWDVLIDAIDNKDLLERKLGQLKELEKVMFEQE